MGFSKSDHVERWLSAIGANYKYRDGLHIAKLEPSWQGVNPCRPGKAIIDEALAYAERMAAGEQAPPAIVSKEPDGYHLLDGRQRVFAAATNGESVFSAYELIEPSKRLLSLVGLGANAALNGIRPSQAYLIDMALRFMRDYDATPAEAARIAGVTAGTIDSNLKTIIVRERLEALGIEPQLSNGSLSALHPFLDEHETLKRTYLAIENAAANVGMVNALVQDMKRNPGKGRMEVLDRWLSRPEIRDRILAKTGRRMTDKAAMFQAARAMKTILKDRSDRIAPEMTVSDKREFMDLVKYIEGKARRIVGDVATN